MTTNGTKKTDRENKVKAPLSWWVQRYPWAWTGQTSFSWAQISPLYKSSYRKGKRHTQFILEFQPHLKIIGWLYITNHELLLIFLPEPVRTSQGHVKAFLFALAIPTFITLLDYLLCQSAFWRVKQASAHQICCQLFLPPKHSKQ